MLFNPTSSFLPIYTSAWLIPCFPLVSAFLVAFGLVSFRQSTNLLRHVVAAISLAAVGFVFLLSSFIFAGQWSGDPSYRFLTNWVLTRDFSLEVGFVLDPMSTLMLLIVSSVAFLVMFYSDSYMNYDQSYIRFFVYLSLFTSSMLGLVLSPNLIQLYFFWELVGVSSYLLIGFWSTRPSAGEAAQKAFVTNRIGDFGFLLGILGFYWVTGSFNFDEIASHFSLHQAFHSPYLMGPEAQSSPNVELSSETLGILFSFFLLLGPLSKSAQFPLHVWLPDAMEGPTPISALIHAATMVAAGIFLVARMFPVFENFPIILAFIAWIGALTAVLGATIAVTQTDLKKGLAYSTVSQLGYMMMALGVGSPTAALFHLTTHAFSKALLFLGSGSVIHAMEEIVGNNPALNQNMRNMGGLRKFMPITSATFLLGTLSICGFPPFSCFWSKDQILEEILQYNFFLWLVAWLTAGLTSFYMFRLYFLTFEGTFRSPSLGPTNGVLGGATNNQTNNQSEGIKEPSESPFQMVFSLLVLAFPTAFIGFLGTPFNNFFESFLDFSSSVEGISSSPDEAVLENFALTAASSLGISFIGLTFASLLYRENKVFSFGFLGSGVREFASSLYLFFQNKWYLDNVYFATLVKPSREISEKVLKLDQYFIDAFVNSVGSFTLSLSQVLRFQQNGQIQVSFLTFLSSLFVFFSIFYFLFLKF